MELLPVADQFRVASALLRAASIDLVDAEPPDEARLQLWPSRTAVRTGQRIEPDAFVTFDWRQPAPRSLHVLIEVKWDADLHENQLQDQWLGFLQADERERCHHLFLGKRLNQAYETRDAEQGRCWGGTAAGGQLGVLSWLKFQQAIRPLKDRLARSHGLRRWAGLVVAYLNELGIRSFDGVPPAPVPLPRLLNDRSLVFWRGFDYRGLHSLGPPPGATSFDLDKTPVFFTTTYGARRT